MRVPILLLTLLVAGCSGLAPEPQDGPGRVIDDPMAIPDAVPRDIPASRYGNPERYEVFGRTYKVMDTARDHRERGIASWYGRKFQGRRTSSGEPYDMYAMTAAHKHLPLPTWVEVRHLENDRTIVVKVNDRGPFADNRIIDLSYAAAAKIGMLDAGTAPVAIRTVTPGASAEPAAEPADGNESDYWIQVAAFRSAGNAERLAERLRAEKLSVMPTIEQGEDGLHRVRLGPLPDADSVDRLSAALDSARFPAGHVIIPDEPTHSD